MNGEKSIFLSLGFWGSFAAVVFGLLLAFDIDPATVGMTEEEFAKNLHGIAVAVAGLVAMVGRIRAKRRVRVLP